MLRGYRKTFAEYGESPRALQWTDYRSAALRYRELLLDLDLGGRSILDVGCGMGDLLPFIYAHAKDFDYLGVDAVDEFIEIAQKRYVGHNFEVRDPFTNQPAKKFDVVVLCGALNANKEGWLESRKEKIKKLFDMASEAVAFNMAGEARLPYESGRIGYADSRAIFNFCKSLTDHVILRDSYLPRDFTITMFKQPAPQ